MGLRDLILQALGRQPKLEPETPFTPAQQALIDAYVAKKFEPYLMDLGFQEALDEFTDFVLDVRSGIVENPPDRETHYITTGGNS